VLDAALASLRAKSRDGVLEDAREAEQDVSEEATHATHGEVGGDDGAPAGAILSVEDPGGRSGIADEDASE